MIIEQLKAKFIELYGERKGKQLLICLLILKRLPESGSFSGHIKRMPIRGISIWGYKAVAEI